MNLAATQWALLSGVCADAGLQQAAGTVSTARLNAERAHGDLSPMLSPNQSLGALLGLGMNWDCIRPDSPRFPFLIWLHLRLHILLRTLDMSNIDYHHFINVS